MKIGITERGDAGLDLSWYDKLTTVDGCILITKNLTDAFIQKVLQTDMSKIIIHATCTGWGHTWLEPNVPSYKWQLNQLIKLIDLGFPANHIVLRIDPIVPTDEGLMALRNVLDYTLAHNIPISRIRISILDEYPHVRERLAKLGRSPFYGQFTAPTNMIDNAIAVMEQYPMFKFETCAEDHLMQKSNAFINKGCVSKTDLDLMNISMPADTSENGQNRTGCHCLKNKMEILTRREQCPHGCIYCYWKN